MADSAAEMLMQTGADVMRLFGHSDRAECRPLANGAIALSGQTGADLNMVFLTSDASREEFDESLDAVRLAAVDTILVIEEEANLLRRWAAQAGLQDVGQMPLMERHAEEVTPGSDFVVRRGSATDMNEAMHLAAAAFALGETSCVEAMPATVLDMEGNDLWLVEEQGRLIGIGVFIRTGDHVGIYTMATPPAHQRRGIGGAILDTAMAHYQARGANRFTLGATEIGYPLYERVGFKVVTMPHVYVVGASTQFPGSQHSAARG